MRIRRSLTGLALAVTLALAASGSAGCGGDAHTPAADGATPDGGPGGRDAPDDFDAPPRVDAPIGVDAPLPMEDSGGGVDAPPSEPCSTAGAIEMLACGMCGMQQRFCTSSLVWEYSACMGEHGSCIAGTTGTMPCGMCGTSTTRCSDSCEWVADPMCTGEHGECRPGQYERTTTGCPTGGTHVRACDGATCAWGAFGACMSAPTDFDGDGTPYSMDCDDTNTMIHAGSTRACGSFVCGVLATGGLDVRAGVQTCTGPGWGTCERPAGCPEPTPTVCSSHPFASETRSCPMVCGAITRESRVCSGGAWTAWSGCPPPDMRPPSCATPAPMPCGACSEGVSYTFCDGSCRAVSSSCYGAGCVPGGRYRDATGCPTGEFHVSTCDATCMLGAPGACTPLPTELDVMILADMTGSHAGTISSNARVLATELAAPLLMDSSVRVGVAYFADFPVGFYGSMGDVPFGGSIAPTTDPMAVGAALMSLPMMSGGDLPESGVEALYVLAGGTPHPLARAMTCPSGTLTGGCWRPGAQRIVVMLTDVAQHNAPSSAVPPGTLVAPYGPDLTPPSPVWIDARSAMLSQGVALFAIVPNTSPSGPMEDPSAQLQLLITELGGNPATQIVTYPLAFPVDLTTAAREMAMRIATFAMLPP